MRCLRLVDRDGNNYVIPKCIEEEDGGANRRLKRFSPWQDIFSRAHVDQSDLS